MGLLMTRDRMPPVRTGTIKTGQRMNYSRDPGKLTTYRFFRPDGNKPRAEIVLSESGVALPSGLTCRARRFIATQSAYFSGAGTAPFPSASNRDLQRNEPEGPAGVG